MNREPIIPFQTTRDLMAPNSSLIIIQMIKQNEPLDITRLYELTTGNEYSKPKPHYGVAIPSDSKESLMASLLEGHLDQLVEVGFIQKQQDNTGNITYSASPNIERIQRIFQMLPIEDLIKLEIEGNIVVRPMFGKPKAPIKQTALCVMLPESKSSKNIYTTVIKHLSINLNVTSTRIEDLFSNNSLLNKNWSLLYHSNLCIADCTGRDPNVFYAVGVAHSIGKPVILVSESNDDIPVDWRKSPTLIYHQTSSGLQQFEQSLSELLMSEFNINSR